jgi:transposase-like protein
VLLCADAAAASADLAGGMLACPSCRAGRLKRWGYGRERAVRLLGGATARLRPQRARCGSCRRTHVLLPSWCAPPRADAIEVIGTAAGMALAGAGYGRIGAGLGVPAATVRGWLRRLRCRAEAMRQERGSTSSASSAGSPVRRCPARPPRRSVTRSTPSPPACTPPSPGSACPGRTCGRCWAGSAWPAISRPPAPADPSRQPGHRHARGPAATLTMTTTAPFPALTASP